MATTAGRIYLHVGLQKTGTSYLQSIVFESVDQLAAQGVAVVPPSKRRTFWVMLDVRARFRPDFDPPEVAESVDHFAQVLAESRAPSALLTEESLAPADPEQIARLLAACGDREVHVVVTLRDLRRQVPSAWQESLKAGCSASFETYLTKLRLHEDTPGHGLWRQKDVPRLLAAWNAHVPSERIHVVTVPRPGSDPTLLLDRFRQLLGVHRTLLNTVGDAILRLNRERGYTFCMIEHDMHVGQLLKLLDDLGIADKTIVQYSTDNGPHYNTWPDAGTTPFRSEKNSNWEGAYRVPAFVRWPGQFPANVTLNGIVSHEDWLPTFAAVAGDEDDEEGAQHGGSW